MSLSDHLRDPGSPVRAFLEGLSPRLVASASKSAGGREAADALGLADLATSRLVIPRPDGVDGTLAGMAFDYRARIALGTFDPLTSAAATGAVRADEYRLLVENGEHRVTVLQGAFEVAAEMLGSGDELDADRASVLLSHCERVVRAGGSKALSGTTGDLLDAAADGADLSARLDRRLLDDLGALVGASRTQLEAWQREIDEGIGFEPNPSFIGAPLVGGADGDWLVGDLLVDSKVYAHLNVSTLRGHLLQLLGYVMLDLDDLLGIRRVAIWLPRQQQLATWTLSRLLGGDPEDLLPTLREGFVKATGRRQLARPVPVPERRRHQMLADNRHTPYEMLDELGRSEDADIRRRVGRNVVTPEATVRLLAEDRMARVREGVASNEAAPDDVLQVLSTDVSKAVRLAVAANPAAPRAALSALTADADSSVRWSARTNDGEVDGTIRGVVAVPEPSAAGTTVASSTDRDETAWDTKLVEGLLDVMGNATPWGSRRLPVPEASSLWANIDGRNVRVPEWLQSGIPRAVAENLLRADRPAWLRRRASLELPIGDPDVRAELLADSDPDVRWWALKRAVNIEASDLTAKLIELGGSKAARVAFRKEGLDRLFEVRPPREYDAEVLEVLAAHRSAPPDLLTELAATASASIRLALIANPALPDADRRAVIEALMSSRAIEREGLARIEPLPLDVVERLAADQHSDVRLVVANRGDLSDELVAVLALDRDWDVRFALLQNPTATERAPSSLAIDVLREAPEISVSDVLRVVEELPESGELDDAISASLVRLAKSRVRSPDLRSGAARHALTPADALERLAGSTDADLREDVAGNPGAPGRALAKLADDDAAGVRSAVARNVATSDALVTDLSHDGDPQVRAAIASRHELDLEVLARLLDDEEAVVRRAARRHPAAAEASRRYGLTADVTGNDLAPQAGAEPVDREVFEALAGSSRAEQRMKAAYDPRTPVDILELLGGERRSRQVRRAVAANPHAPARLLRVLTGDADEQVRQAVAFNGSTPSEVLSDLAGRSIDLAIMVALNPDVPDDVLATLSRDKEPLLRHIAAGRTFERGLSSSSGQMPTQQISPREE
ncbi:hypothetical protein [Microbacterium sp. NPDC055683]